MRTLPEYTTMELGRKLMRVILTLAVVAGFAGASGCQAIKAATTVPTTNMAEVANEAPAGVYRRDAPHTSLLFKLRHFAFSQFIGRLDKVDATLIWDPVAPINSKLDVVIDTASVDTNNREIDQYVKSDRMFNAAKFPTAHFVSSKIVQTGKTTGDVLGDFTMNGQTHPVTLHVTFNGGAVNGLTDKPTLGFSATGIINRADWGMGDLFPVLGHDVTLDIEIEFEKVK